MGSQAGISVNKNLVANPGGLASAGFQWINNSLNGTITGALVIPAGAIAATISVETQNVRYRDDGTAPTSAVGILIASGTVFDYAGPLSSLKFNKVTTGAVLNISYYK